MGTGMCCEVKGYRAEVLCVAVKLSEVGLNKQRAMIRSRVQSRTHESCVRAGRLHSPGVDRTQGRERKYTGKEMHEKKFNEARG